MEERAGWREGSGEGLLEAMDFAAHSSDLAAQIAAFASWTEKSGKPETAAAVQIALEQAVAVRGDDIIPALAGRNTVFACRSSGPCGLAKHGTGPGRGELSEGAGGQQRTGCCCLSSNHPRFRNDFFVFRAEIVAAEQTIML